MNPTAGYSARGSDDEYCSVYRTEGHFYVSCHVDAAPIAWVQRCSICGHVSSSDLRAQLSGGSDGYHTFGELYAHRRALTAALVAERPDLAWRSRRHHPDSDPMFEGSFIVGIDTPAGPVTYHYGLEHWDDFSAVPEVEHAPLWDGAPASASVDRLLLWARRR